MSKLVSKVLATGAALSLLTLPGLSPAVAGPALGAGQSSATASDTADDAAAADAHSEAAGSAPGSASGTGADDAAEASTGTDEASAQAAEAGTQVQLLNITDFHGRISDAGTQVASVADEQRAAYEDKGGTGTLSAGDNIGASPYNSSSADDTPTLDVLNAIGVQASAVGNHEFDRGVDDLPGRVAGE